MQMEYLLLDYKIQGEQVEEHIQMQGKGKEEEEHIQEEEEEEGRPPWELSAETQHTTSLHMEIPFCRSFSFSFLELSSFEVQQLAVLPLHIARKYHRPSLHPVLKQNEEEKDNSPNRCDFRGRKMMPLMQISLVELPKTFLIG